MARLCRDEGRENAVIKPFSDYPSVTCGDSSPDKGSQNGLFQQDEQPIGLYLHIPFCKKKCAYCDFFSAFAGEQMLGAYTERLISEIKQWGARLGRPAADTVYFGGGTPSLLGERMIPVMKAIYSAFQITDQAEITLELNPAGDSEKPLKAARRAGINRLSVGAQSGSDKMLALLGRTHTSGDTLAAVKAARRLGFDNISLDFMLGLPDSDISTLKADLDFILSAAPEHISVYLLKIEENTLFYKNRGALNLPDDEREAEQYLFACRCLEDSGYRHYEISNFAKPGFESRHNLKYWNSGEYLGIGPSAHSFLGGRRFYYPRDMRAFLNGTPPVSDGPGGDKEEYIMLRLRLADGLVFEEYRRRFAKNLPDSIKKAALPLKKAGLLHMTEEKIALTDRGMLVSNSIITELLETLS